MRSVRGLWVGHWKCTISMHEFDRQHYTEKEKGQQCSSVVCTYMLWVSGYNMWLADKGPRLDSSPSPPITTITIKSLQQYGTTNDNLLNSDTRALSLLNNTLK